MTSKQSVGSADRSLMVVSRADFIEHYPQLLLESTVEKNADGDEEAMSAEKPGIDICFEDLSLNIKVGDRSISVVEKVTGRLRGRTMTALMGGSGAGKTSLLNALCGRAFYGETTGTIHVNGHLTSIEEHKDSVGFVPQVRVILPHTLFTCGVFFVCIFF
jgi:ABC-type transport system involved in cytochrome bd biosynthesis fused ATPase/permease subunit